MSPYDLTKARITLVLIYNYESKNINKKEVQIVKSLEKGRLYIINKKNPRFKQRQG